jgi:ribosomal protein S18 acetylase RimI-like enzyme
MDIVFRRGELTVAEQAAVAEGFSEHSEAVAAPAYSKERINWIVRAPQTGVLGVLAGDMLWDWLYVDELWVSPELRGTGIGRKLMKLAEEHAAACRLQGIWLWTQSWQAEAFYRKLGYVEFTRFENFPPGHSRIGFRKIIPPGDVS